MDRRQSDRRPPRDDHRNHRPRHEQDRSRSPPRRDRRDDRRRDRSPARNRPPSRNGPPPRTDRDFERNREPVRGVGGAAARGKPGERPPAREPADSKQHGAAVKNQQGKQDADTRMEGGFEDEDSEAEMQRVMGFKGFQSTKNTKVPGNDKNYGIYKVKKSEYRQYMNRTGGFNRPLSPSRI